MALTMLLLWAQPPPNKDISICRDIEKRKDMSKYRNCEVKNGEFMKLRLNKFIILVMFISTLAVSLADLAWALEKQKISNVSANNDFVVGPTKIEVVLQPTATTTANIYITNRLGTRQEFKIEVEDLAGSVDGSNAAVLLGEARGPYSLKDYLKPEVSNFTLENGERAAVSVDISLPQGLGAGGLYGSVVISAISSNQASVTTSNEVAGQVQTVGRVGVLFFVRVDGQVEEIGSLESFTAANNKGFYQQGPIDFSILYRNQGNVHLNPYGFITVKNIFGQQVEKINIEPFFVLPGSVRQIQKQWPAKLGLGFYKASLALNRGYNNLIETRTINFYVFSWNIIVILTLVLLLLIFIVRILFVRLAVNKKT